MTSGRSSDELIKTLDNLLSKFPPRIFGDDSQYKGTPPEGIILLRFPAQDSKSTTGGQNLSLLIPDNIERAILEFDSIRDFVFRAVTSRDMSDLAKPIPDNFEGKPEDFYEHVDKTKIFDGVDSIPLTELLPAGEDIPESALEAYVRRRVIFSLTHICAYNPDMYFNNNDFCEWLSHRPDQPRSNFYKALGIEPCFLQTSIGSAILKTISFWNTDAVQACSFAIKKKKTASGNGSLVIESTRIKISQVLLIIFTFIPEAIGELRDIDLQDALVRHRFISKAYDPDDFRKLRSQIWKKKTQG